MSIDRRKQAQRRTVDRLARELAFEIAVLRRLERRSAGSAERQGPSSVADVYRAALLRAVDGER